MSLNSSLAKHEPKSCPKCKGAGLIRKKEIFKCTHCYDSFFPQKNPICCFCENIKWKGLYDECDKCFGSGIIENLCKNI